MHVPRTPVPSIVLAVALVIVPGRTSAQQVEPLSFGDAAHAVRADHGSLKAADALVRQREAEAAAARDLRWPTVTFGATAVQMSTAVVQSVSLAPLGAILPLPPTVHLPELDLELQASRFALASVGARYLLYTGGKVQAAGRAADAKVDEARAAVDREAAALLTDLARKYFGLQLRQRARAVRVDAVAVLGRLQHDAQQLEAEGLIARAERLSADVAHADGERELRAASSDVALAETALASLLTRDAVGALTTPLFVVRDIGSVESFKAAARERHPALAQLGATARLAREGLAVERARHKPDVFLFGNQVIGHWQLSDLAPHGQYGIGAAWTLFEGPDRKRKAAAAELQVARIEALDERARRDLVTLVEVRYREIEKARDQYDTLASLEALAEEHVRMRTAAFREGVGTMLEVVSAQLQLSKVRIDRAQAAYQSVVAMAELLDASGQSERFDEFRRRGTEVREP